MNKIPVICRQQCDIFEVNINQNSAREQSLDSEHQLSFDLLEEAVKEIINDELRPSNYVPPRSALLDACKPCH